MIDNLQPNVDAKPKMIDNLQWNVDTKPNNVIIRLIYLLQCTCMVFDSLANLVDFTRLRLSVLPCPTAGVLT